MTEDVRSVLKSHAALIRRIARAYERDPVRREDLVQEIDVAVWRALPSFQGQAQLRTFVARIAHNRCISHVARQASSGPVLEVDSNIRDLKPDPEQMAVHSDLRRKLEAAMLRLPLQHKVVASLALEGFSTEDIAEVLGVSANAAGVRLHRAKAALKDLMGDLT